jgi:CHAT domain-containing protein
MQDGPPLTASAEEVAGIQGKILLNGAAIKNEFVRLVDNYPIIHLATHAVANDENPVASYISFYGRTSDADINHRLYAPEIYNLSLSHVQLVVLSACETGHGQLINGEGMMSLSRAFSYAGCKSTIASLWKADDMATAFISKKLHEYLKKGDDKDIALQKAKLAYLNSAAIEDRFKTPAYWSHLILIGENQAIVQHSWWQAAVILLAIIALLYFIMKPAARK